VDKTVFLGYHINLQTICAIGPKKDAKDAKDTRDNLFKGLFNSVQVSVSDRLFVAHFKDNKNGI
jgi:hypothetical protein